LIIPKSLNYLQAEYTVTVDGQPNFSASSHTNNPKGEFNVSLFEVTDLPFGQHTITMSNTPHAGTGFVDLDWVNIIIGDNIPDTPNNDIWLDNTSKNFTWHDGWYNETDVLHDNSTLTYVLTFKDLLPNANLFSLFIWYHIPHSRRVFRLS
jgi:hypothetical protein